LHSLAQRLRHRVAQPRLQRLIVEGDNLDGFPAGDHAVDRAEVITGATGGQNHRRADCKKNQRAHFNWRAGL
jgi:hypothetical protein